MLAVTNRANVPLPVGPSSRATMTVSARLKIDSMIFVTKVRALDPIKLNVVRLLSSNSQVPKVA
jgi:hypothetical protein